MGLLTILRKIKQREKEIRILILCVSCTLSTCVLCNCSTYVQVHADPPCQCRGLDNAGKTTILKKFNGEDISTISPTLGFNIQTLDYGGFTLNVWDVGGQKSIRSYWRNYFEETDGLVWVVDSADRQRLRDCRDELAGLLAQEKLAGASLLIFASKQDLAGALSCDEIATALGLGSAVFATRHYHICPCSAVTGDGLVGGINWLIADIASRVFLAE